MKVGGECLLLAVLFSPCFQFSYPLQQAPNNTDLTHSAPSLFFLSSPSTQLVIYHSTAPEYVFQHPAVSISVACPPFVHPLPQGSRNLSQVFTMQENDNLYLAYKRNTRYLVQWIVCNYNEVLRSPTAEEQQQTQAKPMPSGQVTVKELVAMATRIGARKTAVPPSIFKCIRSVIDARTLVAETYKMMGSPDDDRNEEVEESNASHAFFIQTLSNIFSILGGDERHESLPATDNDQEAEVSPQDAHLHSIPKITSLLTT